MVGHLIPAQELDAVGLDLDLRNGIGLHCAEEGIIGDLFLSGGEYIAEQAVEQQRHGNGNDHDRQDGKSAAVAVAVIIIIISVWSVLRALIRHGIGLLSLLLHHTIFWCFLQFSRQNVL